MSSLIIYENDQQPRQGETYTGFDTIVQQLGAIGVQFERWQTDCELAADANEESVLTAYADSINRLKQQYGFQSVDVINVHPDHPDKRALRQKFLAEHVHEDFEIRFFIEGCGLFYLHVDHKVYAILCRQGDLISVPANTPHWFDMGENPYFRTIRLFTTPYGWVANFTGNDIAALFPGMDDMLAECHD